MSQKKLSEDDYSRDNQLINKEDLQEFKDYKAITLMAKKHKTTRGQIITALIAAQAKQEDTLSWPY